MAFSDQFLAHFTPDEQGTDVVQLWHNIGINTEKTVLEEINTRINEVSDLWRFSADTCRSWLAFFLFKVRNYISTSVTVTVSLVEARDVVQIPVNSRVLTRSGKIFYLTSPITLQQNQSQTVLAYEGTRASYTGTYSDMIQIQVESIDLSNLELTINGVPIPEVKYQILGQIPNRGYEVAYAIPQNGYYAAYYDGTLYVKVFKGDQVAEPEGQYFVLTYTTCSGYAGKVEANEITKFQDEITDVNGDPITIEITNPEGSNNGLDAPTRWELSCLLRAWFLARGNVSSLPEYQAWFLAQSEVGDCRVVSDTSTYDDDSSEFLATGTVIAQCCHLDGSDLTNAEREDILKRLADVKDLGNVSIKPSNISIYHQLHFTYVSSTNDTEMRASIREVARQYYNVASARDLGSSLFGDLDLHQLILNIGNPNDVVGLNVQGLIREVAVTGTVDLSTLTIELPKVFDPSVPSVQYEIYRNPSVPPVPPNTADENFAPYALSEVLVEMRSSSGIGIFLKDVGGYTQVGVRIGYTASITAGSAVFPILPAYSAYVCKMTPINPSLLITPVGDIRKLKPSTPVEVWKWIYGQDYQEITFERV